MTHVLRYAARTDRGLLRSNNQDSVFAGDRLLVIADGMGGHAAGDVASRLVVAAFVDLDELPLGSDMVRPLTDATREGNSAIAEMVGDNPELDGMGTTLTALLFDGPVVALAHVGDSRAYLYRNGVLHQISHDDTFVQSLVDDGRITADEAAHHPQRSLLLRALNGTDMDPSITLRETSPGDRFLICSDGLSDVVSPEAIADALAGPDPDQVADTLIQLALVAGGPDNVTVIVADVIDTGGSGGFGIGGGMDPEATGPMQPIHLTQKMPRVPLPPIPEDPPAKAEYALADGADDDLGDEADDADADDDGYDDSYDAFDDADPADDAAPEPVGGAVLGGPGAGRPVSGPSRPPRWHRRWALALALAVLVGVGLTGSYMWTTTKYYVGDNDDQVTVFRGVNGSVLGLRLASAQENSCAVPQSGCTPLKVKDLVQAARDQVTAGIPVGTLADARAVVTRLTSQQLPPCPPAGAPPTRAAAGGATNSGGATSSAGATSSGETTSSAGTTGPAPSGLASIVPSTPSAVVPLPDTSAAATGAVPPRTTSKTTARITAKTTSKATGKSTAPARTTPLPTTPALVTPAPVTTTVTVTVAAQQAASVPLSSGQRLRADAPAPTTPASTTPARTTPARTSARPAPAATATRPAVTRPPATRPASTPAPATPGPITRPREPIAAPTVTVFTTVTSTPSTVAPSSSATPLVSPAAQPGVTCRVVS